MQDILENLKYAKNRENTKNNYLGIWRNFNDFVIRLDRKPDSWEDRTSLFLGFLIENGAKSATIKSYKSAIKSILVTDGYNWNDDKILLSSLTRACRLKNDVVKTRLPIKKNLLDLIMFEIQRLFGKQPYLSILYKTLFSLSYHGLLRIGEATLGNHVIKAKNVHIGTNKNKILLVLYSSKTHGMESRPQKIKIEALEETSNNTTPLFCPFTLTRQYIKVRGNYRKDNDQFFYIP